MPYEFRQYIEFAAIFDDQFRKKFTAQQDPALPKAALTRRSLFSRYLFKSSLLELEADIKLVWFPDEANRDDLVSEFAISEEIQG